VLAGVKHSVWNSWPFMWHIRLAEEYCKTYIYWQASNTAVHYAFISSGRGPPPDLFPLAGVPPRQTKIFFCGSWFS
jgi:hypothetical protein